MKHMLTAVALAAAILMAAGCSTSVVSMLPPAEAQTSSNGKQVVANLEGSNWGIFLFYGIPLWSGNPNRPNRRDYVVGQNRIKHTDTEQMLKHWAEPLNAEVEDVAITESSTGFFSLWILWRRSSHATAVAVKKE